MNLDPALLARLRAVDTPTVCNAIEVAEGRRGFAAFTRAEPRASDPGAPAMVGFASTARIRGSHPPEDPVDDIRARRRAYFRAMAAAPKPAIAVIEDLDPTPLGAWWGEVHAAVHKGLGLSGALTNGLMRDLGDLAEGFPILAGGVGVSHGFVHVVDIGTPVEVLGLRVAPGALIHADRHGAVAIPTAVLPRLLAALDTLEASEALILGPATAPDFDIDRLLAAWAEFERART